MAASDIAARRSDDTEVRLDGETPTTPSPSASDLAPNEHNRTPCLHSARQTLELCSKLCSNCAPLTHRARTGEARNGSDFDIGGGAQIQGS